MSRYQFSLRALLVATALLSLALAGRHWLLTRGPYIVSATVKGGQPAVIRARIVRLFGPSECPYSLQAICRSHHEDDLDLGGYAKRSWFCLYDIEERLVPVNRAGGYSLVLQAMWPDAEVLRGDLIIEPQPPNIIEPKEPHGTPWKTLPPPEKPATVPLEV